MEGMSTYKEGGGNIQKMKIMSLSIQSLTMRQMKKVKETVRASVSTACRGQMLKNEEIEWSFCPRNEPTHMAASVISMQLGLTRITVTDM